MLTAKYNRTEGDISSSGLLSRLVWHRRNEVLTKDQKDTEVGFLRD